MRGRKPRPGSQPRGAQDVQVSSETLLALLANVPERRQQELVDALLDRSCGIRLWLEGERKPGTKVPGVVERPATLTYADGTKETGHVYLVPPDAPSAKLLIETGWGRPAVRESAKSETAIYFVHRVAGRRDRGPKAGADEPGPVIAEVEEPVVMEDRALGLHAAIPADPEDVLAGDE